MKVRNGKELGELLIRKGFVNTRGGVDRNCSFRLFGITPRQLGNWLEKEEFNANQQKMIDLQSGKEAIQLNEFKYPDEVIVSPRNCEDAAQRAFDDALGALRDTEWANENLR